MKSNKQAVCAYILGNCPGMLPALVTISTLSDMRLSHNRFAGRLPDAWGAPGAFPYLADLYLGGNCLSGTLPAAWGGRGQLPELGNLSLEGNALEGSIPDSWVLAGAFATFIKAASKYPTNFPSTFPYGVYLQGVM